MVICGDALTTLKELERDSIHACVTSPPYYNLRDYGEPCQIGGEETPEKYIENLVTVFREVRRVLRPDGTLWINIGDTYAANRSYQVRETKGKKGHTFSGGAKVPDGCKAKDLIGIPWLLAFALRKDGWYLRQDIIWHKPNAMPESVKDRCTKSHEYVFLLSKSKKYHFDAVAIREQCSSATMKFGADGLPDLHRNQVGCIPKDFMRNKRDVWSVNTGRFQGAHFAVFPEKLIEPCILAGCPEGGTVLDPFAGSGTTGVVAKRLKRDFIGVEINPVYCQMAMSRIKETIA